MKSPFFLLLPALLALPIPAGAQRASGPGARQPVLMISIDGLMPEAVLQADAHGLKIPVLRGILERGSYAQEVVNVNPTVTNPNHVTLVTGVLPREHGIHNNRPFAPLERAPATYRLYSQIGASTLWGAAKQAGLTTGSIFWPVTDKAGDIDFNITRGADEDEAAIARDAAAMIAEHRPQFLTVHFVSLDHRAHEAGPFSAEANAALERIDAAIGMLIEAERRAHPGAVVAIVSDHGFAPASRQVHLNVAFADAGLLTLGGGSEPAVASWRATAWYVGAMAMIVVRDPRDHEAVQRIRALLDKLAADPANGIEGIHDRADIAGLGLPPVDFVVGFKPGYRMGTALTGPLRTPFKGGAHGAFSTRTLRPDMHSAFLISGPGVAEGRNLGTIDIRQIAPTLALKLGVVLPAAKMPPLNLKN
ncbi:alkaline phosphatase family protein [Sphingomonas kyeonggiensis]|uniref:Putative AlkP superfamily pyrophosphatase or phosphodiesterase n=1 Tax=Sphingomonas kyeonggiensis TaxID=1268553 RepID=A0A7W6JVP4_9SPHN|nr:alkaline phosphatase family protein [Sphingomonas kyeonggiensis]MBB4100413.1 putative AlkP superfamily pyrophosphatase or phosphodiesterase [Sphingomonas kyeonggiensis]